MKNHHIWIEGSSCTYGYHDESKVHGFGGRIAHHFQEYSAEGKRRDWDGVNEWVYVHNFSIPGRSLPLWTPHLADHAAEILQSSANTGCQMVGMFVLEAHPLFVQSQYGVRLFDLWRSSMEKIQEESVHLDASIVVQMPIPGRRVGERGQAIFNELTRVALNGTASMDNTQFIEAADMPGFDSSVHLADDRMHPNAAGHQLMADQLIPLLHDTLQLKPRGEYLSTASWTARS